MAKGKKMNRKDNMPDKKSEQGLLRDKIQNLRDSIRYDDTTPIELVNSRLNALADNRREQMQADPDSFAAQIKPNTAVIGYGGTPRALNGGDNPDTSLTPYLEQYLDEYANDVASNYGVENAEGEFQQMENIYDYLKYMQGEQRKQNYLNDQLYGQNYGDAIAEILGNSPQGQTLLNEVIGKMRNEARPTRERQIDGTGSGGYIQGEGLGGDYVSPMWKGAPWWG